MKILGISFGTKNGNHDSITIEALKAAKLEGAEVEFIRMSDLNISQCTGCCVCVKTLMSGGGNMCVLKDDFDWLLDKMYDADGIIMSDPIFAEGASGLFHDIIDRFGPRMDRGNNIIGQKIIEAQGSQKKIDPRFLNNNIVISYMASGGSEWGTRCQVEHAMQALTPLWKIIDNKWFPWSKCMVMDEEKMEEVRQVGKNIVEAVKDLKNATYKGEKGICPHCHSNLFYVKPGTTEAICSLCGIEGKVSIEDNEMKFSFTEEEAVKAHDTMSGKFIHGNDIKERIEAPFSAMMKDPAFKALKKEHAEFIKASRPEKIN